MDKKERIDVFNKANEFWEQLRKLTKLAIELDDFLGGYMVDYAKRHVILAEGIDFDTNVRDSNKLFDMVYGSDNYKEFEIQYNLFLLEKEYQRTECE